MATNNTDIVPVSNANKIAGLQMWRADIVVELRTIRDRGFSVENAIELAEKLHELAIVNTELAAAYNAD